MIDMFHRYKPFYSLFLQGAKRRNTDLYRRIKKLAPVDILKENLRLVAKAGFPIELPAFISVEKEGFWLMDRKTYFVRRDVVKWLSGCKFDFLDFDEVVPLSAGPVISFAFESGSVYAGLQLSGFLFSWGRAYHNFIQNYAKSFEPKISVDETIDVHSTMTKTKDGSDTHLGFSYAEMRGILCGDLSINDWRIASEIKNPNYIYSPLHEVNDEEAEEGLLHCAAAMSVLIYVSAFPETLHEGPPKGIERIINTKQFTIALNDKLKAESAHGTPCAHWRRGHFRELRDDRFKRNDDGTNRIVFVHDCIVAQKDQEIYTVEDPE